MGALKVILGRKFDLLCFSSDSRANMEIKGENFTYNIQLHAEDFDGNVEYMGLNVKKTKVHGQKFVTFHFSGTGVSQILNGTYPNLKKASVSSDSSSQIIPNSSSSSSSSSSSPSPCEPSLRDKLMDTLVERYGATGHSSFALAVLTAEDAGDLYQTRIYEILLELTGTSKKFTSDMKEVMDRLHESPC